MPDLHVFDAAAARGLLEVIGSRRSIRYFQPYRPVERWKIEVLFQAAHRSSRAVNASFIKVVAVERDSLDPEARDELKTPTNTADMDMAPLYLFTYSDPEAPTDGTDRLKDLFDRGAFSAAIGWSHRYIDEVVWQHLMVPMLSDEKVKSWMAAVEAAQAIAHIQLAATALGLGACCKSWRSEKVKERLAVPDHWEPMWMMLIGYPAEDPNAGGQRPRAPLSDDYFWGDANTPFEPTEEVTKELERVRLLQPLAPVPWRQAELRFLARGYGLPEE